jgi:phospholipid/cholesterol/gamma-HCH transport system substrate-binding protein
MNEPQSQIRTGLFVLIGAALLGFSILFFGGDRSYFTSFKFYKIKFKSTQGLDIGSVVSISGLDAGNVTKIEFADDSHLIAHIKIKEELTNMLGSTSLASIRTQGALGDKYIYIVPGDSTSTKISENDFIATDTQPDILDMISGKATDLKVILDVMRELNQLLNNINANGRSAQLVDNVVAASGNLSKLLGDPNLKDSFVHLKSVLKKVDSNQGTLGLLVNDSSVYDRLLSILGEPSRNQFLKPMLRDAIRQNEKQR